MAADPIAAANELAGQTYAGAQGRTDATKKALLDNLAANGTYQNTVNQADVAAAAPQPVTAPGTAQASMLPIANQGQQQVNTMGQAALAAATALAAHNAQQQAQANTTYFDQASAAMPLEQSRSASQAQQILADLQAKREAAAAAKEQASIQLEIEKTQLAQAQTAAAAAANKSKAAGGLTPNEQLAVEQSAIDSALPANVTFKTDPITGKSVPTPTGLALSYLSSNPGVSIGDYFTTHGLTVQQQNDVITGLNNYHNSLASRGYYAGASPAPLSNPLGQQNNTNILTGRGVDGNLTPPSNVNDSPKSKAKSSSKSKISPAPAQPVPVYGPTGSIVGYVGVKGTNGYTGPGQLVKNGKVVS